MAGDEDRRKVFEALFVAHYWAVRAYALRRNAASVEDVLSDVFLIAWRRLESMPADPLPWLLGVARRVMANERRGERRRAALDGRLRAVQSADIERSPSGNVSDGLAAALRSLSEREREALLLVAWEGLEPGRAAKAAGCSAAAFRVRLHRARRRVAARLAESAMNPEPQVMGKLS